MSFVLFATVFACCCFLHLSLIVGLNSGTKFTKEPPDTVYAGLGSDAEFQWNSRLAIHKTGLVFEQIIWGETDNNDRIRNKYVTIPASGLWYINPELDDSIKNRVSWTGNISRKGCNLVFILRNVTTSDEITYGCTAIVYGDDILNGPKRLVASLSPTITNPSNATVDVEDGDNVTLQCDAIGDPMPNVLWMKDGDILQDSNTTTALYIPNIELKDAGRYVCTATNEAGSASRNVQVRVVRDRPRINKNGSSNSLVISWIDHVTILKCAVDANPPAKFTWFKDGQPILIGVNSTRNESTLTLTPKTAGDFGLYWCNATNNKGTMRYLITVKQLRK
ncbi:Neural cell adhesion molecule 1 [Desmophyllum pertusum]|uniref:Neural cell adhesion molecule 1 n=1 Tax=Desmophyllum pertusum TaxID=174260 RepID=A0A9W9ZAQ1_9CNID|nr:Neural cell adhesion molecule 1 [Desmophyllum pertusum]